MATPQPAELEFVAEFFFNHEQDCLTDRSGMRLSGVDVLERVFKLHCDTVHVFRGMRFRTKLLLQHLTSGLLGVLVKSIEWALKALFGRTLEDCELMAGVFKPYKADMLKKLDADSLDLLGYRASKQVVVLMCGLVIAASIYRYVGNIEGDYLAWLSDSEFLSLAHGLFLIWFLDVVAPWLLFWTMNGVILVRTKLVLLRIRGP